MSFSIELSTAPLVQGSVRAAAASPDSSFPAVLQGALGQDPGNSLERIFARAAEKYNLPENLLKAIGYIESRFTTDAVSSAGAMGVMQLMPQTAAYLGVTNAFDPEQNIMGAAKLLSEHLEQYKGDMGLALAAYNCGVGTVAKYGNTVPPFTQNYIRLINEVMEGDLTLPAGAVAPVSSPGGGFDRPMVYARPGSGDLDSLGYLFLLKMFERMTGDREEDKRILP